MLLLIFLLSFFPMPRERTCTFKVGALDEENFVSIAAFLKAECRNNTAIQDIQTVWRNGLGCWIDSKSGNTSWCTDYSKEGYKCIKGLTDDFELHVPSEEKFISDFMLSGHNRTMEEFCKNGEQKFQELLHDSQKVDCKEDIGLMASKSLENCVAQQKFANDISTAVEAVLSKSGFCELFRDITECMINSLEEQCTDHGFSSFLNTIFRSHLDWCNEDI